MGKKEKLVWEQILLGKDEASHRERIRANKRYAFWKETWTTIQKAKKPEDYMWLVFNTLQKFQCMGFLETVYVKEALVLFLQDMGVSQST